jgi:RNase adaptor protein for sRNA GlmZ degradation
MKKNRGDTQTHRQQGNITSLLLFFKNKKSELEMKYYGMKRLHPLLKKTKTKICNALLSAALL